MGSMSRRRDHLREMGLSEEKANAVASAIETLHNLSDGMENATWEWTADGKSPQVMLGEIEAELKAAQDALSVLKLELED